MKHKLKELLLELQGEMKIETSDIKKLFVAETGMDKFKLYRLWKDSNWELTQSEIFATIDFFNKHYKLLGKEGEFNLQMLYIPEKQTA